MEQRCIGCTQVALVWDNYNPNWHCLSAQQQQTVPLSPRAQHVAMCSVRLAKCYAGIYAVGDTLVSKWKQPFISWNIIRMHIIWMQLTSRKLEMLGCLLVKTAWSQLLLFRHNTSSASWTERERFATYGYNSAIMECMLTCCKSASQNCHTTEQNVASLSCRQFY